MMNISHQLLNRAQTRGRNQTGAWKLFSHVQRSSHCCSGQQVPPPDLPNAVGSQIKANFKLSVKRPTGRHHQAVSLIYRHVCPLWSFSTLTWPRCPLMMWRLIYLSVKCPLRYSSSWTDMLQRAAPEDQRLEL